MNDQETALYKAIGNRIREARTKAGMSQATLAEKVGISLPHMSNIECGKKKVSAVVIIRIAETLNMSTDALLRPNVPEVRAMYSSELAETLRDCTPAEADSILKIVKQLKETMKRPPEDEEA